MAKTTKAPLRRIRKVTVNKARTGLIFMDNLPEIEYQFMIGKKFYFATHSFFQKKYIVKMLKDLGCEVIENG